jgi:hypothetical protein
MRRDEDDVFGAGGGISVGKEGVTISLASKSHDTLAEWVLVPPGMVFLIAHQTTHITHPHPLTNAPSY